MRNLTSRRFWQPFALALVAAVVMIVPLPETAADEQTLDVQPGKSTQQIIDDLIEKLGSDSYATRVRARDQLKAYGLEAFDALHEAQYHDDSEILSAARYLMKSLQVSWSKESDPKQVRDLLYEYGAQSTTDRLARIELLGRLPDQLGIEALSRLARFDRSIPLSRRAAMLVLKQPLPAESPRRMQLAEQIETVVGDNQRDSAAWLRAYADDLREGGYSPSRWFDVIDQQRQKVDAGVNAEITAASVVKLIKVLATRAMADNARDDALELVKTHLDLIAPATRELAEHCDWAIAHELYPVVMDLYKRHRHPFSSNSELMYSAAQAYRESGDSQQAKQLADLAFVVNPLPSRNESETDPPEKKVPDRQLEDTAFSHYQVAKQLKSRGQFDWAEREYEAVIACCDIETNVGAKARYYLSLMYGEQLRHEESMQTLATMVDRLGRDSQFIKKLFMFKIPNNDVQSLFHYQHALSLLEQAETKPELLAEAKEKLQLAYRNDSGNIDILIRMYRVKDTDDVDWEATVMRQYHQYVASLQRSISQIESSKKMMSDQDYKFVLGFKYNEYAWLIANTEGDYERALKCSKRSLDFLSDEDVADRAARLDTCARCYFALGRFEEAVETQKKALRLDRYSLPMRRQLKEFEAAL